MEITVNILLRNALALSAVRCCMPCCRDHYTRKVAEQENLGKALREKQKSLRENQESNATQVRMWRDVERLLDMKRRLAAGEVIGGGVGAGGFYGNRGGSGEPAGMSKHGMSRVEDEDRLVL